MWTRVGRPSETSVVISTTARHKLPKASHIHTRCSEENWHNVNCTSQNERQNSELIESCWYPLNMFQSVFQYYPVFSVHQDVTFEEIFPTKIELTFVFLYIWPSLESWIGIYWINSWSIWTCPFFFTQFVLPHWYDTSLIDYCHSNSPLTPPLSLRLPQTLVASSR